MPEQSPVRLFYSYSHKDENLRNKLETHLTLLRRQGLIEEWHDRRIGAGQHLDDEIDKQMDAADIILLLVSPEFLQSDYCYGKEMKRALELDRSGRARVIPIILRPVDWQGAPFAHLLALPKDGKPVTTWKNRDEAWVSVATGIRSAIAQLAPRIEIGRRSEALLMTFGALTGGADRHPAAETEEANANSGMSRSVTTAQSVTPELSARVSKLLADLRPLGSPLRGFSSEARQVAEYLALNHELEGIVNYATIEHGTGLHGQQLDDALHELKDRVAIKVLPEARNLFSLIQPRVGVWTLVSKEVLGYDVQEDVLKVAHAVNDQSPIDGPTLCQVTGLTPKRVNVAALLLKTRRQIDLLQVLGTAPFMFAEATANHKTRQLLKGQHL